MCIRDRVNPLRSAGGYRVAVGIQGFERRLENLIEGTFARVFRSGLNPVELGRKLVRTLDDKRSVGVNGRVIVPNDFTFVLAEDDYEQMADMAGVLARDLGDAAREHARDMGYSFAAVSYTHLDVYKRQLWKRVMSVSLTRSGASCCTQWVLSGSSINSTSSHSAALSAAITPRRAKSFRPQMIVVGTTTRGDGGSSGGRWARARYQLSMAVIAPGRAHARRYSCLLYTSRCV